jgi:hypothetical protein
MLKYKIKKKKLELTCQTYDSSYKSMIIILKKQIKINYKP